MPDNQDEPAGKPAPPTPVLDQAVQDHLGQKLRAAYAEAGGKPTYLGDRAYDFAEQLEPFEALAAWLRSFVGYGLSKKTLASELTVALG